MSTAPDLTVQGTACKTVYIEFDSRRCLDGHTGLFKVILAGESQDLDRASTENPRLYDRYGEVAQFGRERVPAKDVGVTASWVQIPLSPRYN